MIAYVLFKPVTKVRKKLIVKVADVLYSKTSATFKLSHFELELEIWSVDHIFSLKHFS